MNNYTNKIIRKNGRISVFLEIYTFKEGDIYYAYSPALDLTGYGNTEKEAKESLDITLCGYMDYCISNNTLKKDLLSHGWDVRSEKQRKIPAPSFDRLLRTNATFRNILKNKDYRKITEEYPEFA